MGFRTNTYATIWDVESVSDTLTKARISISRKNKQTGEYDTDFSGFVSFIGTSAAKKAAVLKERDRIRLGDVDVTNKYDKESGKTYTNYKVFSFEPAETIQSQQHESASEPQPNIDDGNVDDERLPF